MIEVTKGQKEVKVTREFAGLQAFSEKKTLDIVYLERTLVDDVCVKTETKQYSRDYAKWRDSTIGVAIMEMVNADLSNEVI